MRDREEWTLVDCSEDELYFSEQEESQPKPITLTGGVHKSAAGSLKKPSNAELEGPGDEGDIGSSNTLAAPPYNTNLHAMTLPLDPQREKSKDSSTRLETEPGRSTVVLPISNPYLAPSERIVYHSDPQYHSTIRSLSLKEWYQTFRSRGLCFPHRVCDPLQCFPEPSPEAWAVHVKTQHPGYVRSCSTLQSHYANGHSALLYIGPSAVEFKVSSALLLKIPGFRAVLECSRKDAPWVFRVADENAEVFSTLLKVLEREQGRLVNGNCGVGLLDLVETFGGDKVLAILQIAPRYGVTLGGDDVAWLFRMFAKSK